MSVKCIILVLLPHSRKVAGSILGLGSFCVGSAWSPSVCWLLSTFSSVLHSVRSTGKLWLDPRCVSECDSVWSCHEQVTCPGCHPAFTSRPPRPSVQEQASGVLKMDGGIVFCREDDSISSLEPDSCEGWSDSWPSAALRGGQSRSDQWFHPECLLLLHESILERDAGSSTSPESTTT